MANNKKFKTLNGFWTSLSPVKEGKNKHNFAEGQFQTADEEKQKILFFFEKPYKTNKAYENALNSLATKNSCMVSQLVQDSEGTIHIDLNI